MSCIEKMDADCVIYNMGNPLGGSSLFTLNLPNGVSLRAILERIDQLFALANGQNSTAGYDAVIQALGTTDNISNIAQLLLEIANQLKAVRQLVANVQNYAQKQFGQLAETINGINNPAIAAGPLDIHDTLSDGLEKLASAVSSIQDSLPKISALDGNQLSLLPDGFFVKGYNFPLSGVAGNALAQKQDGYYVNQSTNGMSTEQLMEMLVNAGLNADENSSLSIKLKQLIQSYLH